MCGEAGLAPCGGRSVELRAAAEALRSQPVKYVSERRSGARQLTQNLDRLPDPCLLCKAEEGGQGSPPIMRRLTCPWTMPLNQEATVGFARPGLRLAGRGTHV
jgi:hypothetical protein